jgi:hypothetical protein
VSNVALLGGLCGEGLTDEEFCEVIARVGKCACGRVMMLETLRNEHRCIKKLQAVIDLTSDSEMRAESTDLDSDFDF